MPSLRTARRDARELLKETRWLLTKHGAAVPKEELAKVQKARDELDAATKTNQPDLMVGLSRRLDELLGVHFQDVRKGALRQNIESIGGAVLVALLLRLFVVEMYKIPSGSMVPTLLIGDHLFISKFLYGIRIPFVNRMLVQWGVPHRGDVIVFNSPRDPSKDLIKRVAAVPGDTLEVRDEVVYLNGEKQPRERVDSDFFYWDYDEQGERWFGQGHNARFLETLSGVVHDTLQRTDYPATPYQGPFHVPADSVFVMGDNRDNSADSRFDGGWTVPYGNIKGKAFIIVFSWGKGGWWFCHGEGALCTDSGIRTDRFFHIIH